MSNSAIMYQLESAADRHPDWRKLAPEINGTSLGAGIHIAVMIDPFLTYILDGTKTIESRFSKHLIAPYQRIHPGDLVFLKAGPIVAAFRASTVECVGLTETERARLREDYSERICADEEFWAARADRNYATLIGISQVQRLTPLTVPKHDRRGWLVLRERADVRAEQLRFL